jgi:hypothetical protein
MSAAFTRTRPRESNGSLTAVDRFTRSRRWLPDIRRTREYRDASGYPMAYRSALPTGIALETAPRRYRTKAFDELGGRFAVWLSRRFNIFRMG